MSRKDCHTPNSSMAKLMLVFFLLFLLTVSEAARGARGGSRGGSRSGSSRSSSRSRSSSSSSRSRSYKYGPYSSKVTKYTPIPVRTKTSPVIIKQTKVSPPRSRTSFFTGFIVGSMASRYTIYNAPIYRQRYRSYESEVEIPEERAIRVINKESKFLDSKGSSCIKDGEQKELMDDINERVAFTTTSVQYDGGSTTNYVGRNQTVEIDKSVLDQDIKVSEIVKFNGPIIQGTNCTQISNVMEGTVVRLYSTNPDHAGIVRGSTVVIILSFVGYFIFNRLY